MTHGYQMERNPRFRYADLEGRIRGFRKSLGTHRIFSASCPKNLSISSWRIRYWLRCTLTKWK